MIKNGNMNCTYLGHLTAYPLLPLIIYLDIFLSHIFAVVCNIEGHEKLSKENCTCLSHSRRLFIVSSLLLRISYGNGIDGGKKYTAEILLFQIEFSPMEHFEWKKTGKA